ncbi:MAG: HEAT repeat domain-containing protein [Longimicrobiales bacterium]
MRTIRALVLAAGILAVAQPVHGQDRRAAQKIAQDQLRKQLEVQQLLEQQKLSAKAYRLHASELAELEALKFELQHMVPDMKAFHELEALKFELDHAVPDMKEFHELEALKFQLDHAVPDMDALYEFDAMKFDLERAAMDAEEFGAALDRLLGDGPREAWAQQDPADSLWRQARERFNANNFREAVRLFNRIHTESRFANSAYRIDAQYWEAYALSRLGSESDLTRARELLRNVVRFPVTQRSRDAEGLLVTVDARLARLGNREAEQALVARASNVTGALQSVQLNTAEINEAAIAVASQAQGIAQYVEPWGINLGGDFGYAGVWPALSYNMPRQCRSDEEDIRMVALNALARLEAETAMPVLREVMNRRGECSEYLRRQALSVAARHRTPDAIEMIASAARNDPDPVVRTAALQLLLAVDEERGLGMVEERLRAGTDTTTMHEAIAALTRRTDNERAARLLLDVATRAELAVGLRRDAIRALGRNDNAEIRQSLRQLYSQSTDQAIREALISAGTASDTESVDWLLQIALDANESERSRQRALSAAARNRAMTVDRLVRAYDQLTDPGLQRTVVNLLARAARTESAAVDKLLDIARNATDIEVRKAAIVALASSDDPRARDLLLDILRR